MFVFIIVKKCIDTSENEIEKVFLNEERANLYAMWANHDEQNENIAFDVLKHYATQ